METIQQGRVSFFFLFPRSPVLLTVLKQYNNIKIRLHPTNAILLKACARTHAHKSPGKLSPYTASRRAANRYVQNIYTTFYISIQTVEYIRAYIRPSPAKCRATRKFKCAPKDSFRQKQNKDEEIISFVNVLRIFQTPFGVAFMVEVFENGAQTRGELYYFSFYAHPNTLKLIDFTVILNSSYRE